MFGLSEEILQATITLENLIVALIILFVLVGISAALTLKGATLPEKLAKPLQKKFPDLFT